jgi:hypothetical protein
MTVESATKPAPSERQTRAGKLSQAHTIASEGNNMTLSPFRTAAAAPNRRPEATEAFRHDIDKAIAAAQYGHVDPRTLADILDQHSESLRLRHAVTAPFG